MLTSITPLGERGRGSRWAATIVALALGSALAGAAGGLAAGAAGVALDLGIGGDPLPGPRRQVNEQWLGAYRGWVYGIGFGLQLGLGVATIVSASAVYATFAAAALSAAP